MLCVLIKVGLDEFAGNFDKQKVSPDIVCFLSAQELRQLGLSRKEEMIKLRMKCIKYGANRLQMRTIKSGPPEFVIPKCILQNLIDDDFLISDIAKLLSVSESTVYRRMRQYNITKDEGILDPLNDMHIAALHSTFLPKINEKLDIWKEAWARHRMRTVHSSPRTLWIAGQLQAPVGISISDLVHYGAEGIMDTSVEDTVADARPVFNCREYNLSNQCRQHLETVIHATWISHNFGIDIYLKALDIIRTHSNDV
ncbi:hypothetical protein CHS0354_003177 [Potamilus streckersoni]|uniref:Integrase core domain-containing protein n=1 Tax=Potamilus streckersoni TaxID=2493646 RepID=A0AAE0WD66_9BIVA|nr:hypothetical protein CHS0354_003177 [Potamilus streckersoni]